MSAIKNKSNTPAQPYTSARLLHPLSCYLRSVASRPSVSLPMLGLSLCTTFGAMSAHANMPSISKPTPSELRVGANVMFNSTPYDVKDAEVLLLPSVYYDNDIVYARGNRAGVYAINNDVNQLDVFVMPEGTYFDPDNANDDKGSVSLKGLDERKRSVLAGASYTHRTPIGAFRLQAATDVLGKSDGIVAKAAYLARYSSGNLTLYPSIGVAWYDDSHNDYYYSVSKEEAAKTGVAEYEAQASLNPYVSLNANYQFNEKWAGFFGQNITYIADEQHDSPMVVERAAYRTTFGLTYTF